MSSHGTYTTVDERPAVRFERRLPHPVADVWRMVTDSAELSSWFPCEVELELRLGGRVRFTFGPDLEYGGEVLELDPPRRLAFSWGVDLLSFDLAADGDGTRLTMVHVLNEEGEQAAAKVAAGWHLCLDAMERRLAGGREDSAPSGVSPEWLARYDEYRAQGVPSGAPVPGLDAEPMA